MRDQYASYCGDKPVGIALWRDAQVAHEVTAWPSGGHMLGCDDEVSRGSLLEWNQQVL